jgi:signal transduction histidine kinase
VVLIHNDSASLRDELFARSKAFAALATKPIGDTYLTYQDSGTVQITHQIVGFTQLDSNVTNVLVVDTEGNVQYRLHRGTETVSSKDAASFVPVYTYSSGHSIQRIIYPFIEDDGGHQYAVVYDISSAAVDAAVGKLVLSIVLYSLFGLVVSAVVSYLLINRLFLIPIKQVRDRAIIISAGQYSEQIMVDRNDEIGDLAHSVARMAKGLQDDITKLREVDKIKSEFMLIASHYLRTPLTVIDGYLELAKSQDLNPDVRGMLDNIEVNSQRLGVFAEDLLIISSIEAGQKIFNLQPLSISAVLAPVIEQFKPKAAEKHITFMVDLADSQATIQASSSHLQTAIHNLLDNAFKFTPENGTVELSSSVQDGKVQIVIKDNGPGIAPGEVDKLFTKFHRGTSTLEYDYEGSGIGLYLTKLVITEHGGTISASSEQGKGAAFIIALPVSKS